MQVKLFTNPLALAHLQQSGTVKGGKCPCVMPKPFTHLLLQQGDKITGIIPAQSR